jgi:hypothetical protein
MLFSYISKYQHSAKWMRSQEAVVHSKPLDGKHSSNVTYRTACEKGCLSGRAHLRTVTYRRLWSSSPDLCGWERVRDDSSWTPCWTTLPEAAKACLVQKDTSVSKQILSVHSCASVQDSVTENKQANLNIIMRNWQGSFSHVLTHCMTHHCIYWPEKT